MSLAISLPLAAGSQLVGTCFVAGIEGNRLAVVTALHHLAGSQEYAVVIPPHHGDLSIFQPYPRLDAPALKAVVALAEPLLDLGVLIATADQLNAPIPRFINSPRDVGVGEEIVVVGYPFAPLGSMLETAQIAHVSARGARVIPNVTAREEFIISIQTHVGASGSPVVRRSDGVVCGVVRGCLAPPSVLAIGNIPLGTDTSVTYATSAHTVPQLVAEALATGVRP